MDSSKSFHISTPKPPHSHFLLLLISFVTVVNLLHLMNQYQHVIVHYKGHSLFIFPQFLSDAPFPFQDPIQNTKLHLIFMSSKVSLSYNRFSGFVFDKMFICGTGQVYCRMPLYWNSSNIFLMVSLGLCIFQRKITE